jgi:hypothetical protein
MKRKFLWVALLFSFSCATYQDAVVLDKNSRPRAVQLIDIPCSDYYQEKPAVLVTKNEAIALEQVSAIKVGGVEYLVVPCEKTSWQHECNGKPVLLKILAQGRLKLAETCSVRWMNTMLSKNSMDVLGYAYLGEDTLQWQNIQQDPKLFIEQSKIIFPGNRQLQNTIETTGYRHPVPDAKPGYVSEYEMVLRENLEFFFKTYNQ